MANSVDPDETARYEPALFAKVIMLFCNVLHCWKNLGQNEDEL